MRAAILAAALVMTACGGQANDVCRSLSMASLTSQRGNTPDYAKAACECWEGDGWTPRLASGCTNLR